MSWTEICQSLLVHFTFSLIRLFSTSMEIMLLCNFLTGKCNWSRCPHRYQDRFQPIKLASLVIPRPCEAQPYNNSIRYHTKRHPSALPCPQSSLVDSHAGALSSGGDAFLLPLIKSLASYFLMYVNPFIIWGQLELIDFNFLLHFPLCLAPRVAPLIMASQENSFWKRKCLLLF